MNNITRYDDTSFDFVPHHQKDQIDSQSDFPPNLHQEKRNKINKDVVEDLKLQKKPLSNKSDKRESEVEGSAEPLQMFKILKKRTLKSINDESEYIPSDLGKIDTVRRNETLSKEGSLVHTNQKDIIINDNKENYAKPDKHETFKSRDTHKSNKRNEQNDARLEDPKGEQNSSQEQEKGKQHGKGLFGNLLNALK